MTIQRVALLSPTVAFLSTGREENVNPRFEAELARLRALGFDPVEATPEIVAPVVALFEHGEV